MDNPGGRGSQCTATETLEHSLRRGGAWGRLGMRNTCGPHTLCQGPARRWHITHKHTHAHTCAHTHAYTHLAPHVGKGGQVTGRLLASARGQRVADGAGADPPRVHRANGICVQHSGRAQQGLSNGAPGRVLQGKGRAGGGGGGICKSDAHHFRGSGSLAPRTPSHGSHRCVVVAAVQGLGGRRREGWRWGWRLGPCRCEGQEGEGGRGEGEGGAWPRTFRQNHSSTATG